MTNKTQTFGWIGTGRMGYAMAARLLKAGYSVSAFNRTREKALGLEDLGGTVVHTPHELSDRDVVFTMVSAGPDLEHVLFGENGLLTGEQKPKILVDSSTVDIDEGKEIRERVNAAGVQMLAAPVSGNGKVVEAGLLTVVASGPRETYDAVEDALNAIGRGVTYAGEGEGARLVKVAHNLMLGVVTQCMAEITVLTEKGGIDRSAFLEFLNDSVMGSMFTRYKTPTFVNLDLLPPTFTPVLLRKDFELGLAAGKQLEVPMPLAALVHQVIHNAVSEGHTEEDFAVLHHIQARNSGLEMEPENVEVHDGLDPVD